jgi:ATP-dependent protease Clp ATPase subunit
VLLAKLQEKRGGNRQIQLIKAEPCEVDTKVIVITRGGIFTGQDRVTQGNTTEESGVGKATEKTQTLMKRKKNKCLRWQERNSEEINILHQRFDQK